MIDDSIPEKKLFEISKKFISKVFLLIITIVGYFQALDYIRDKIPVAIELTQCRNINTQIKSSFEFSNRNSSIDKSDFITPLEIIMSDTVTNIYIKKKEKEKYDINLRSNNDTIFISFALLNKNEKFIFEAFSKREFEIKELKYRIKNVDNINFYHFKNNPKPISRIFKVWLFTLLISILLFFDALLVILKDRKLGELKKFVFEYDLTKENKGDFLEKYRLLYNEYPLRIKTPSSFFIDYKIKNLLNSFQNYNNREVNFIRLTISYYTEFFVFYRIRTIFIIISPILFTVSVLGICFNYFYYELPFLRFAALDTINYFILKFILMVFLFMILFPRQTMNYFFIKKETRKLGNFTNY